MKVDYFIGARNFAQLLSAYKTRLVRNGAAVHRGKISSEVTARGRPARERTGPPPLLLLDRDLDFSVEYHQDQQQEEKIAHHFFLRSGRPAGWFPPAFGFWAGYVNQALSHAAQLPSHILDTLPGDPARPGTARHRPFDRFCPQTFD